MLHPITLLSILVWSQSLPHSMRQDIKFPVFCIDHSTFNLNIDVLQSLLNKCLTWDPERRPIMHKVLRSSRPLL